MLQESSFLLSTVALLTLGLAFSSGSLTPGSPAYFAMSAVTLAVVGAAILGFVVTLTFEVYCSLQYAAILNTARMVARQVEESTLEAAIKQSAVKRSGKAPVRAGQCFTGGGGRWKLEPVSFLSSFLSSRLHISCHGGFE